jgi:hypothetical protein
LYSSGTITNLGSFLAAAINDNGVLAGGPSIDSGGTVQNLNTLIPAGSPYQIKDATAIKTTVKSSMPPTPPPARPTPCCSPRAEDRSHRG